MYFVEVGKVRIAMAKLVRIYDLFFRTIFYSV